MEQNLSPPYSDNRLVINDGELNLQRLAAIVVAVEVLPYNLHCSPTEAKKLSERFQVFFWLDHHGWKILEELSIPEKIRDLVRDPMKLINTEIDTWLRYHIPEAFVEWHQKRDNFVLKFIRHFVWTSLGTIDYVKTAEKWIADVDLEISIEQKYRLACLNCLKDTVENLYYENAMMADGEMRFPLVYYWNYRIAGEIIDIDDIASSTPPYVHIWANLLEHMDEEERYSFSTGRMMKFPARVVKDLLPKFTEIEQRRLFGEKLPQLMRLFLVESFPQFAIQLWRYVNNTISAQMYYDVFDELCGIDVYFSDDGTSSWLSDLGMEMWRCASNNLKESMFQYKNGDFLCKCASWVWFTDDVYGFDFYNDTFLLEMLSDASPEYRKQFWEAHWDEVVMDCNSTRLAKLIEACLPKPNGMDEFLEELANSSKLRNYLEKLCQNLLFDEFTKFLDQFIRDTKLKADLKKRFVPSEDQLSKQRESRSISVTDFDAWSALLIEVYGSGSSIDYKAKFFRAGFIDCISDLQLWSSWDGAEGEIKPIGLAKHQSLVHDVERLCDEEELQAIKKKLLAEREFFQDLAKEKKNRIVWEDLLKWLVGGKQAMEEESSLWDRSQSKVPNFLA